MRKQSGFAAVVGFLLLTGAARAATDSPDWARCRGVPPGYSYACPAGTLDDCKERHPTMDPALMVPGCSAVIAAAADSSDDIATAYYLRGKAYDQTNDNDRAIADESEAIRRRPNFIEAYYIRARADGGKDDYDHAIADATAALTRPTEHPGAWAEDEDGSVRARPVYGEALVIRATAYSNRGDFDRAIADADAALTYKPGNAPAYLVRGNAHGGKGDLAAAIADFTQVIAQDPGFAMAYRQRGMAYVFTGRPSAARPDLDKAIALDANDGRAFLYRGMADLPMNDTAGALRDADKAVALLPGNPDALGTRCEARTRAGQDLEAALVDCARALAMKPHTASWTEDRAVADLRLGHLDAAIADADATLSLDAKSADGLYVRGLARRRKGDAAGGDADIAAASAIDPNVAVEHAAFGVTP